MNVFLNNKTIKLDSDSCSLSQCLNQFNVGTDGYAIALNNDVIPRSLWNDTLLKEGDKISLFQVIAGG